MSTRRDRERLQSEMEELFSDLGRARPVARRRRAFRPPADVFRTDDPPTVTVVCELAGVDPAEIHLEISDGVLTIAGVRRRPPSESVHYQQVELDYGPFERLIGVGGDVDGNRAEAVYDRGILTVRLPLEAKREQPVTLYVAVVRQG